MSDIKAEDKLRLIRAIRQQHEENHYDMQIRRELIKPDEKNDPKFIPNIRLIVTVILVIMILLSDHYQITIGGVDTDQFFRLLSMDITTQISDWPTRLLFLPR